MAAVRRAWPTAWSCFVGGRRRAAVDGIDLGAILVGEGLRNGWRTVSVVRRPLPLFPRANSLARFASQCTGTTSAASPRCWGVPVDEVHRPWWAGRRWAQRWALRQLLAVLGGAVFISMVLAALGDQMGWVEVRRGAGV